MTNDTFASSSVSASMAVAGDDRESTGKRWWHVNRKLLPMKAHYFFFFGSFAGVAPVTVLFCGKVGMSMSEIGILFAVLPFLQFFSKIVVGSVADKYRKHKTAFMGSMILMGVFMLSVVFMPLPTDDARTVIWTPADDATFECRPRTQPAERSSSSSPSALGMMQLTLYDRNASNPSFAVLSAATVACNVSCDASGLHTVSTLLCDKDNHDYLSNDTYTFYENETPKVEQSGVDFKLLNLKVSPGGSGQVANSSYATLPIISVSFEADHASSSDQSEMRTQSEHRAANKTTVSSCHADLEKVSISCLAVCDARVKPSANASGAAHKDMALQYVWIWVAYLVTWCCFGTLMSTSDTILLHLLDERTEDFGNTRLFASFGWGLMAPVIGLIVDKVSEGRAEKDYSPSFYLFGVFILADFIVNLPTKVNIPDKSKDLAKDVFRVLRRPPLVLLVCVVFVNGMTTGFLWTFLVVYVNDLSGGEQLVLGLNYAFECFLSEIPFFIVSGWVVSKLGHSHSMTISLFVCGLKTFLYSLLYNPWYILFIALMHGLTYGLLYASMATYIDEISPPGTAATFQGIFQGIFEGVGVAAGNLVGGYAYEELGGRQTMVLFGVATMGAAVVHFVVARILEWIARPQAPDPQSQLPSFVADAILSRND